MYPVVLLDALHAGSHESCEVVVAVVLQVDGASATGVGGQSVLGEVDGWRVEECQEVGHAALLGHAQELALSGLVAPVVGAVSRQQALRASRRVDLSFPSLLLAACSQVEAPD